MWSRNLSSRRARRRCICALRDDRAKAEEFGDGLADGRGDDCTTVFITTVREGKPTSVYLMGDIE